jgi:serine/threonine-protein kinase
MGKLNIICESCGAEREVDEKLAGSMLPCANCDATIKVPIPNISAGMTLGGFVLERQLGFGAMGEVWLARQTAMDRQVALKLLSREYTLDSSFVDRFLKEVRISAKMDHPNIITAFDAGCDKDIHYLAITYVDGETLEDKFEREGALPEEEALRITLEIAEALRYAWNEFKIIHRDIKPANIMIDNKGSAKLMDMGISKSANEGSGLTMTGTIIGTPYYMSPEQGTGERDLDFHSDIYSLGATLYHVVTGVLPFDATTALGIVSKHITEPLPSPLDKNPNVSEQCSSLIETMMAKSKNDRQDSWEEVAADIRLVLSGEFPASKPRPSPGDSLVMPAAGGRGTIETKDAGREEVASDSMPTNIFNGGVEPPPIGTKKSGASKASIVMALVAVFLFIAVAAVALFLLSRQEKTSETGEDAASLFSRQNQPQGDKPENAEPEPKSSSPVVGRTKDAALPTVDSAPVRADDERLRRCEEMFKFAEKYAADHPDSYDLAIKNFKELAKVAGGTKYKLMANVKVARIEKAKEAAIAKVLDDLSKQAKAFAEEKQFDKAARLYGDYTGPMSEETRKVRERLAGEFNAKAAKLADENKRKEKILESQRKKISYEIARNLASGRWSDASSCLRKMELKSKKAKKLQPVLLELSNMRKSLLSNLKKQKGKTVVLDTKSGTKRVTVAKVKGGCFYHKERKGKVVILRKHAVSELPPSERARIAGLSAPATLAFSVSEMVGKGDFPGALGAVSKSKSSFAKFLGIGVRELLAEKIFVNLLRRLHLSNKLLEPDKLMEKINGQKPQPLMIRRRSIAARVYRRKFESTLFARKYTEILDVLENASAGEEMPNETTRSSSSNRKSPERAIGDLVLDAITKAASKKNLNEVLANFNPRSVSSPNDIREVLRKISPQYKNGGRFIFRRGRFMVADLFDCAGINDDTLVLLSRFQLKMLDLGNTDITDLTPLENMSLAKLIISETDVKDLTPLKNMHSLRHLSIADTKVTDVTPIRNLDLEMLDVSDTGIRDLRAISKMPLRGLRLIHCSLRSYSFLRKLDRLEALEPRELWRKIPGKEQNANRPQNFHFKRGDFPPPDNRDGRFHIRGFDD